MKYHIILAIFILISLTLTIYCGKLNNQLKTSNQQKKEIEYALQKKSHIYSEPNADSNELLKLMRAGKL